MRNCTVKEASLMRLGHRLDIHLTSMQYIKIYSQLIICKPITNTNLVVYQSAKQLSGIKRVNALLDK